VVAEYIAPEQANPQIHAALGRIIRRCMALRVEDRYRDAAPLLADIDAFMAALKLDPEAVLPQLLSDPQGYGAALTKTLPATYFALGKAALARGQTGPALEHFDRVLSLQPGHPEVHRILDRMARRSLTLRLVRDAALAIGGALVVALALTWWLDRPATAPAPPGSPRAALTAAAPPGEAQGRNVIFVLQGRGDLYLDGQLVRHNASGTAARLLQPGPHVARYVGLTQVDSQSFEVPGEGPVSAVQLDARGTAGPTPAAPAAAAVAMPSAVPTRPSLSRRRLLLVTASPPTPSWSACGPSTPSCG
jgi:hypothetical protein